MPDNVRTFFVDIPVTVSESVITGGDNRPVRSGMLRISVRATSATDAITCVARELADFAFSDLGSVTAALARGV